MIVWQYQSVVQNDSGSQLVSRDMSLPAYLNGKTLQSGQKLTYFT